jgi:hypothetical protein
MKRKSDFIHGGGWTVRKAFGRPKARFFAFLALIWLIVAVIASLLLWPGIEVPMPRYWWWLCMLLAACEPFFIGLALVFWRVEKPRAFVEHFANPDYDAHNLY